VAGPGGGQSGVTSALSRGVTSSGVGCWYTQSGSGSDERGVARMRVLKRMKEYLRAGSLRGFSAKAAEEECLLGGRGAGAWPGPHEAADSAMGPSPGGRYDRDLCPPSRGH